MDIKKLITEYNSLGIESTYNYEDFNKILITTHSTQIEGSTLSFEEASELILKGNTPGGKSIDFSLMALDHYKALDFVLKEAELRKPITLDFIKKIASLVMKSTGKIYENVLGVTDTTKGDFRLTSVRAGDTVFMNFQKVPEAMNKLILELNNLIPQMTDIEDKLLLSFYAHYELVNIHPFLDGNGRSSRLLMNYIQRYYRLPLGLVFSEDKPKYYQVLDSVKETESFETYDEFMIQQYAKHLTQEIKKANSVLQEPKIIKPRFKR